MSIHALMDNVVVGIGGFYGDRVKFFRNSVTSKSVIDHIKGMKLKIETFTSKGEYNVAAKGLSGDIHTKFRVTHWHGLEYPTVIFHHGSGDYPYYKRITKIMAKNKLKKVNVIATCAPFNDSKMKYIQAMGDLEKFVLILANLTVVTEEIVQYLKNMGNTSKIIVSGISLGGWTTNLHHAVYNTADQYRPILAGTKPADLFIQSSYRKLASKLLLNNIDAVRKAINFDEEFAEKKHENVYPLLANYDQYVVYDVQSKSYDQERIHMINKGHITASMDYEAICNHILGEL